MKNKYYVHMSGTVVLLIFFSTLLYKLTFLIIIYISVLIHEFTHVAVCIIVKTDIESIDIYPHGINLKIKKILTPKKQILVSAAGPLVSLFLSVILGVLYVFFDWYYIGLAASVNFLLFAVNAIPALPLDGGEILKAVISMRKGLIESVNYVKKISEYVLGIVMLIGILIAVYSSFNISLITLSVVSVYKIANCGKYKINTVMYILTETFVSNKKHRRYVNFCTTAPAFSAIPYISTEYTLLVMLYDDTGKFVYCVSQKEILHKILSTNECILMSECVEKN